eukprot:470089-Pyramimonas_sp.AAC.1
MSARRSPTATRSRLPATRALPNQAGSAQVPTANPQWGGRDNPVDPWDQRAHRSETPATTGADQGWQPWPLHNVAY